MHTVIEHAIPKSHGLALRVCVCVLCVCVCMHTLVCIKGSDARSPGFMKYLSPKSIETTKDKHARAPTDMHVLSVERYREGR